MFSGFTNTRTPRGSSGPYELKHEKSTNNIWFILGNPGATSRDDGIFSGESLLEELERELILTELVPEVVGFRPADWAEKYFFCPISNEV